MELHLNEASILAKMCYALINLEGGGGGGGASAPLAPPGSDPDAVDPQQGPWHCHHQKLCSAQFKIQVVAML